MTKIFLSLLIILLSIFMYFMNHPLTMGIMILIQTLLICLISGMLINTYWFSYILFLTFLGGLLVLFIYVSSIASNELFINNFNLIKIFSFCFISLFFISLINYNNIKSLNIYNSDMNSSFNLFIFFNNENKMNLSKLYNNQTFLLMMMLIIYLFITLVVVVKITNIFYGPLRSSI